MRHALLIGVAEYASPKIARLPSVAHDLKSLSEALVAKDFRVTVAGSNLAEPDRYRLSRSDIRKHISDAVATVGSAEDDLLIYYSGHGLHLDGVDYMVPSDTYTEHLADLKDCLVSTDIAPTLDRCNLHRVVVLIDACREGISLDIKGGAIASWGTGRRARARARRYTVVFSCEPGQLSHFADIEGASNSLFTSALVGAIKNSERPFLQSVQTRLSQLTAKLGKNPQVIRIEAEGTVEDSSNSAVDWILGPAPSVLVQQDLPAAAAVNRPATVPPRSLPPLAEILRQRDVEDLVAFLQRDASSKDIALPPELEGEALATFCSLSEAVFEQKNSEATDGYLKILRGLGGRGKAAAKQVLQLLPDRFDLATVLGTLKEIDPELACRKDAGRAQVTTLGAAIVSTGVGFGAAAVVPVFSAVVAGTDFDDAFPYLSPFPAAVTSHIKQCLTRRLESWSSAQLDRIFELAAMFGGKVADAQNELTDALAFVANDKRPQAAAHLASTGLTSRMSSEDLVSAGLYVSHPVILRNVAHALVQRRDVPSLATLWKHQRAAEVFAAIKADEPALRELVVAALAGKRRNLDEVIAFASIFEPSKPMADAFLEEFKGWAFEAQTAAANLLVTWKTTSLPISVLVTAIWSSEEKVAREAEEALKRDHGEHGDLIAAELRLAALMFKAAEDSALLPPPMRARVLAAKPETNLVVLAFTEDATRSYKKALDVARGRPPCVAGGIARFLAYAGHVSETRLVGQWLAMEVATAVATQAGVRKAAIDSQLVSFARDDNSIGAVWALYWRERHTALASLKEASPAVSQLATRCLEALARQDLERISDRVKRVGIGTAKAVGLVTAPVVVTLRNRTTHRAYKIAGNTAYGSAVTAGVSLLLHTWSPAIAIAGAAAGLASGVVASILDD